MIDIGSGIHLDRRFNVKGRKKSIGKPITCLQVGIFSCLLVMRNFGMNILSDCP